MFFLLQIAALRSIQNLQSKIQNRITRIADAMPLAETLTRRAVGRQPSVCVTPVCVCNSVAKNRITRLTLYRSRICDDCFLFSTLYKISLHG